MYKKEVFLMNNYSISLLGGDLRQYYTANYLINKEMNVSYWGNNEFQKFNNIKSAPSLEYALKQNVLICPVPFSKDNYKLTSNCEQEIKLSELYKNLSKDQLLIGGNIPKDIINICSEKQVSYYDYMNSESLGLINAEITAEGLICEILSKTPFILQNTDVLLLGYGKCGKMIANKLDALGCNITVCDCQPLMRALSISFGYKTISNDELKSQIPLCKILINTVPSSVLEKSDYSYLSKDCTIFDIASMPGGIDKKITEQLNIPTYHCLGLPGKTAPLTAGEAIGENIYNHLKHKHNKPFF